MSYGTIKVDSITFTNGGTDETTTVSGIYKAITSGVTVSGTISGTTIQGQTISGVTVTGTTAQFTNITGGSIGATTITGTTVTGTTANFVSGVFTTQISGVTVTGTTANFTSGNFSLLNATTVTVGTNTGTSGQVLTSQGSGTPTIWSTLSAIPVGCIQYFAMNTAPSGYLKANGTAVSRSTYSTLFATIGTTFGAGDGSTTFNLPDLRGQFVRSWADNGTVYDSGRTFGSTQADAFKSHSHNIGISANKSAGAGFSAYGAGGTSTTDASGGTETRPVNIALLACIKF
jgi:microcystin-dependent protein